ncbi:MAG TPA: hypothetical protein VMQ51_07790 [Candidatus Binatia bacterium]|nr:hypothetical protein [Candidatus Binatia bacterium]
MLIDRGHRQWIAACVVILAICTAVYVPYVRSALNGPSGGSFWGLAFGILGSIFMLFAGVLGARRKVPTWQIGRATFWLKGHIWLGLISYPIILFHAGFGLGGPLTIVLMVLFTIVVLSGIFGIALQQVLPRLLLNKVPLETVYEQIDSIVGQLRTECDELVAAACGPIGGESSSATATMAERRAGGGLGDRGGGHQPRSTPRAHPTPLPPTPESGILRETYVREIRPFLDPHGSSNGVLGNPGRAQTLFRDLRTALPILLHPTVGELETTCEERRQLRDQKRLHHWLHGWLMVHVPLSLALLLLGAVHAIVALRY